MWAIINYRGEAIPVSDSERGAKSYATRNGYKWIGYISPSSWVVVCISQRVGSKWKKEAQS